MVKTLLPNTALLIFIRSASLDAQQKPLAFRKKKAQKIAALLNAQALKLAASTNLNYFVVDETLQKGADFGSRLDAAFQYVFAKGFQHVISIGNDCLDLSKEDLQRAALDLQHQDLVLGPTQKGGLYLLGMSTHAFAKLDFKYLPWQTQMLYADITKQCKKEVSWKVKTYELYWEINHIQEWNAVLRQLRIPYYLVRLIKNLLQEKIEKYFRQLTFYTQTNLPKVQLRGPPQCL
jgi:hypothetical protein